jgi:opacity protein-like surface antigen
MRIRNKLVTSIMFIGLLTCQNIFAGENDEWVFEVTPYFLAAGLDGEIGVRGVTTDIDMSFSDIWDDLDAGFMGLVSAQKDRWIFNFEGVYFKISDQGSKSVTWNGPLGLLTSNVNGALDLSTELTILSASVGYRLLDEQTKLDLIGGLRYTDVQADIDLAINGAFTGPLATRPFGVAGSADGDESWTDAVIGARVIHPVSDNVDLVGYVDAGGSSGSNTYQWLAGVNWEFKEDYTAKFGYRVLDWDYEDGGFEWDMQSSGMYAGVGIRF